MLAHQRDFEILSEDLLGKATISEGRLELAGQRFAFLVLPETRMLHDATLNKAHAFLDAGGHVAFVGSLPTQNPNRGECAATVQMAKALMASVPERTRHMAELDQLGELIGWMARRAPPDLNWDGPSRVRIMRRREPDRDIVLVANPSPEDAKGNLTAAFGGEVSLWNPETGAVDNVGTRTSGQPVSLSVPADSARFVVIER